MRNFLENLYSNHVFSNLAFALVIVLGIISYNHMPREQDPTINFNWIQITTLFPGASAGDVEAFVTDKIEEAIDTVSDIRFISSNSRESVSNILVRFNDLPENEFDKRLNDLRREIQNKEGELPDMAKSPKIIEINSSNAYPTAMLVVLGDANDELLRKQAKNIKDEIERFTGVDRCEAFGLHAPELQVTFNPDTLARHNINANDLAMTLQSHLIDESAGTTRVGNNSWLIRWVGKEKTAEKIGKIPVMNTNHEVNIDEVAIIARGREKPTRLVNYDGKNGILLTVMKKGSANTIELVDQIEKYIQEQQSRSEFTGINLKLLDDQTEVTKNALSVMQNNAYVGLLLVLAATCIFLGFHIAFLVSIGIPFTLCATFWFLDATGNTLNVSVLLGVVITLGMLVDDSVVVVEAIYYRLVRGMSQIDATIDALKEVAAPVLTSVLTTTAAFVPLMMLPGILGKFMFVIPMVVTVSLLISLLEAFWMLPSHINSGRIRFNQTNKYQIMRDKLNFYIRIYYIRYLIKVLRNPKATCAFLGFLLVLAITMLSMGLIKVDFFASDPMRIFYINVEMPAGASLEKTLEVTTEIEQKVRANLKDNEYRSVTSYSGLMLTETATKFGDQYGQISVSLHPEKGKLRHVDDVIESMRKDVVRSPGPLNVTFLRKSGGPPTSMPINIKVRGDDYDLIRKAVDDLKLTLQETEHVFDISDDDTLGRTEMILRPDYDAIYRAGIDPKIIARIVRLLVDGEIISDIQDNGEKVDVRLKSEPKVFNGALDILSQTIAINGREIRLAELVHHENQASMSSVNHYDLKRTITVLADIDKNEIDTVTVNERIQKIWADKLSAQNPTINLNFSGELDDINESIEEMPKLFLMGVGIIYLILGTQFRSYWQPFMILATIPLAFTGVTFGLFVTRNPLSLYTLYGIVALSGITVNASIVLISAANQRIAAGMSVSLATIFAARRRVIPILITSITTIAGLFSLATGLGGKSLLWGPVATSIVWGLFFSTSLTMFVVPLMYMMTQKSQGIRHTFNYHALNKIKRYFLIRR